MEHVWHTCSGWNLLRDEEGIRTGVRQYSKSCCVAEELRRKEANAGSYRYLAPRAWSFVVEETTLPPWFEYLHRVFWLTKLQRLQSRDTVHRVVNSRTAGIAVQPVSETPTLSSLPQSDGVTKCQDFDVRSFTPDLRSPRYRTETHTRDVICADLREKQLTERHTSFTLPRVTSQATICPSIAAVNSR